MFAGVGRKLALFNAAVVIAAIALSGMATYLLLRISLEREADQDLAGRIEATRSALNEGRAPFLPPADAGRDDGDDDDPRASDDLLDSGETLIYLVDAEAGLVANLRGIDVPGLPDAGGLDAALRGSVDARTIQLGDEAVRVRSEPLMQAGSVIGAVQAARGEEQHREELDLVRNVSLGGIGLGALLAVPAGLFLARRAMTPIGAAFERQRAFVADASHELRTPLALVRANAELAQRLPGAPPEVQAELAEVISEVDRAARLIDDLLLLARTVDPASLPRERVDLGAAAREAATALADRARDAGLVLMVSAPDHVMVRAESGRVRQLARILLDNAIAYTPAGGTVALTVEQERHGGRLTVRDTGIGIAPVEQGRVFDRFYRTDASRSRQSGGAGLGLAIARGLVESFGGQIGLESAPGRGTSVWFTLPFPE